MLLIDFLTLLLVHMLVVCFVVFGLTFCRYMNGDLQELKQERSYHSFIPESTKIQHQKTKYKSCNHNLTPKSSSLPRAWKPKHNVSILWERRVLS